MRRLLPCAALLGLGLACTARAETAVPRIVALDDAQLAQARGRGLPAGQAITGFQLQLVSTWIAPQGAVGAAGTVQVEGLGGGPPSVRVAGQASGNGAPGGGGPGSASGGLPVQGVGQLTQVAGDANQGYNRFTLRLVDTSTGLPALSAGSLGASYAGRGTSASVAGDGHGGLVVAISTPAGSALQSVGGVGSFTQALRIVGNGQRVDNSAMLTVLTRSAPGLGAAGLLSTLQNMIPRH